MANNGDGTGKNDDSKSKVLVFEPLTVPSKNQVSDKNVSQASEDDDDDPAYKLLTKLNESIESDPTAKAGNRPGDTGTEPQKPMTAGEFSLAMQGFDDRYTRANERLLQLGGNTVDFADQLGKTQAGGSDSPVLSGTDNLGLNATERSLVQQIPYMAENLRVEQALLLIGNGGDKEVKNGEKLLTELVRDNPALQSNQDFQTRILQKYVEMAAKRKELGLPPFKSDLSAGDIIPESQRGKRNDERPNAKEIFDQSMKTLKTKGIADALPSFGKANERAEQNFQADRFDRVNLFVDGLKLNSEIAQQSVTAKGDLQPLLDRRAKLAERETASAITAESSTQTRRDIAINTALAKIGSTDGQLFEEGKRELRAQVAESPTIVLEKNYQKNLVDAFAKHYRQAPAQELDDKPSAQSPVNENFPDENAALNNTNTYNENKLTQDKNLDNQLNDLMMKIGVGTGLVAGAGLLGLSVARSYRQAQQMRATYGIDALTTNNADVSRSYRNAIEHDTRRGDFRVAGATRDANNRFVVLENKGFYPDMDKAAAGSSIPVPEHFNPRRGQFGPPDNSFTPINIEGKMFYAQDGVMYSQKGQKLEPTNRFVAVPEANFIRDNLPKQLEALASANPDSKGFGYASDYIKGRIARSEGSVTMAELATELSDMAEKQTADKPLQDGLKQAADLVRQADRSPVPTDRPSASRPTNRAETQVESLPADTSVKTVQEVLKPLPVGVSERQIEIDFQRFLPKGALADGRIWLKSAENTGEKSTWQVPKVSSDFDPKSGRYDKFLPVNVDGRQLYASPPPGTEVYSYMESHRIMFPVNDIKLASPGEVAFHSTRPANPYLSAYRQARETTSDMSLKRGEIASQFTWSGMPTKQAMIDIYNFAHGNATNPGALVSMGAGNGYWEKMMEDMGLNLDGAKYDGAPIGGTKENGFHNGSKAWTSVAEGGPAALAQHGNRTLFLSWPPHSTSFAHDTLQEYTKAAGDGARLIYVGEQPDTAAAARSAESLTADTDFFNMLDREYKLVKVSELGEVQFGWGSGDCTADKVYMYERKPASERPNASIPTITEQEARNFINTRSETLTSSENRIAQFMKEAVFANDVDALMKGVELAGASKNPDAIFRSFQADFEKLGVDVRWNTQPGHDGLPGSGVVAIKNKANGWEVVADSAHYAPQVRRAQGELQRPFQAPQLVEDALKFTVQEFRNPEGEFKTEPPKPTSAIEKFVETVPEGWGRNATIHDDVKSMSDFRALQLLREGVLMKDATALSAGMYILQESNPEKVEAIIDQFKQDMKGLGLEVPVFENAEGWPRGVKLAIEDPETKGRFEVSTESKVSEQALNADPNFAKVSTRARATMGESAAPGIQLPYSETNGVRTTLVDGLPTDFALGTDGKAHVEYDRTADKPTIKKITYGDNGATIEPIEVTTRQGQRELEFDGTWKVSNLDGTTHEWKGVIELGTSESSFNYWLNEGSQDRPRLREAHMGAGYPAENRTIASIDKFTDALGNTIAEKINSGDAKYLPEVFKAFEFLKEQNYAGQDSATVENAIAEKIQAKLNNPDLKVTVTSNPNEWLTVTNEKLGTSLVIKSDGRGIARAQNGEGASQEIDLFNKRDTVKIEETLKRTALDRWVEARPEGWTETEFKTLQSMKDAVFSCDRNSIRSAMEMAMSLENGAERPVAERIAKQFEADMARLGIHAEWRYTLEAGEPAFSQLKIGRGATAVDYSLHQFSGFEGSDLVRTSDRLKKTTAISELQMEGTIQPERAKTGNQAVDRFVNSMPGDFGYQLDRSKSMLDVRTIQLAKAGIVNGDKQALDAALENLRKLDGQQQHRVDGIQKALTKDLKDLGIDCTVETFNNGERSEASIKLTNSKNSRSIVVSTDTGASVSGEGITGFSTDAGAVEGELRELSGKAREGLVVPQSGEATVARTPGESTLLDLRKAQPDLSGRIDQVLEKIRVLEKAQQVSERLKWSLSAEGSSFLSSVDGLERLETLVDAAMPARPTAEQQVSATVDTPNVVEEKTSHLLQEELRSTDTREKPAAVEPDLQKIKLPGGLELFVDKSMEKAVNKYVEKYNQDANFKDLLANRLKRQEEKIEKESNAENKAKLIEDKAEMEREIAKYSSMPEAEKVAYREAMLGEAVARHSARVAGRQRLMRGVGTAASLVLVGMIAEHALEMIPQMSEPDGASVTPKIL